VWLKGSSGDGVSCILAKLYERLSAQASMEDNSIRHSTTWGDHYGDGDDDGGGGGAEGVGGGPRVVAVVYSCRLPGMPLSARMGHVVRDLGLQLFGPGYMHRGTQAGKPVKDVGLAVIVLDGLSAEEEGEVYDEFSGWDRGEAEEGAEWVKELNLLVENCLSGLRLVLSTEGGVPRLARGGPVGQSVVHVEALGVDDHEMVVNVCLDGKTVDGCTISKGHQDVGKEVKAHLASFHHHAIDGKAAPSPLYIKLAVHALSLKAERSVVMNRSILGTLPRDAAGMVDGILSLACDAGGIETVKEVVRLLLLEGGGYCPLSKVCAEGGLDEAAVQRVLKVMAPLLEEDEGEAGGGGGVGFSVSSPIVRRRFDWFLKGDAAGRALGGGGIDARCT
jgi:hypothetical protein